MPREHLPCAMCERFDTAKHPQQAAAGLGRCTGFDQPGQPEAFVAWDNAPYVLFKEARDRAPRARYVAQQQAQQQELEKA
jgi:hypothetical protein